MPSRLPGRLVLVFVLVSAGGLLVISGLGYFHLRALQAQAAWLLESSRRMVDERSTLALNRLGEQMIRQQAELVARQVGLYLAGHPDRTLADLRGDEVFADIAVQPVGQEGYTALTDYDRLITLFHRNPRIVDLDLQSLAGQLPEFWRIMSATRGGREAGGYYDWREADGRIRQKYVWIAIVPGRTADNVGLSVAATTYIDEFSRPSAQLAEDLAAAGETAVEDLRREGAKRTGILLAVAAATLLMSGAVFAVAVALIRRAGQAMEEGARRLAASEQTYRSIYDTAPLAFVLWDLEGRITGWNSRAESMFGWSREEALGRNIFELLVPPALRAAVGDVVRAILAGEVRTNIVNENLTRDGRLILCQWSNALLRGEDGRPVGAMSLALDITRQERTRLELEGAREAAEAAEAANRAKSEFLANMSHEIRTPMTAIMGFADVLLEQGNLEQAPPERTESLQIIKRNGEYLLGLINDILDLSKIEAGRMSLDRTRCSPGQLLAEVISLLRVRAEAKSLSLELEYLGPLPETIETDATRFRQILINVVGNAIKFTEVGGVRLLVRLVDAGGRPMLQADVVDTGVGIPPDAVGQLFELFSQVDASARRQFGGTGLGLAISRRLARMLGGDVELIDSRPGLGTRFRVCLPVGSLEGVPLIEHPAEAVASKVPAGPAVAAVEANRLAGLRILLAEDGADNQRLIAHVLRRAGAAVTVVENGSRAVDAAMTAQEEGTPFDVVLMDMQMPVIDGYEATRLLRVAGYTRPVVALTAHAMPADRRKCIDAGCDDYTTKPIDRQRLIDAVLRQAARLTPAGA